jgi:hypothetical protein
MKIMVLLTCLAFGLGALVLLAAPQEITFSRDVKAVLEKECVNCHGAKRHKADLDLSADNAMKNLLNVPSSQVPAMVRVKPGDPEQSYLWLKLDHRSQKGGGMPKIFVFSKRLPQDRLDLIKAWIAGGAKE